MNCILWAIHYDAAIILEYFHKALGADITRRYKETEFEETCFETEFAEFPFEGSPFLFAIYWKNINSLHYIIGCGAYNLNEKIKITFPNNLTAIELAINGGNKEIIGLIQDLTNKAKVLPNKPLKQSIVNHQSSTAPVTTLNVSDTKPMPLGWERGVSPNDPLPITTTTTAPNSQSLAFNQMKKLRRIFVSYCWKNSKQADILCVGKTDPREITKRLEDIMKEKCWLDIDVANGGHPLFDAIAMGIFQAEVIIVCISDDYVQSKTCEQELTYTSKTCKKLIIPVVVGETMNWQFSGCGFLLSTELYIDFRDPLKFTSNMNLLIGRLQKILS